MKASDEASIRSHIKDTHMEVIYNSFLQTINSCDLKSFFDFSFNKNICFSSDYSGENDESKYYVYTFTYHSFKTLETWSKAISIMKTRKVYRGSLSYKDIKPTSREGKLRDWMATTRQCYKGIIVSFGIDKKIESLFAPTIDMLYPHLKSSPEYSECPFSPAILEKALRIAHFSSLVLSQIVEEGGNYFWMMDNDATAQGEKRREFTSKLQLVAFRIYANHLTRIKPPSYSTPWKDTDEPDHFSEDFISLSDLISGAMTDFCNNYRICTTPEQLHTALKAKSIEILASFNAIPIFAYILDKDNGSGSCKRFDIRITEPPSV